jgi:hypothetical protein
MYVVAVRQAYLGQPVVKRIGFVIWVRRGRTEWVDVGKGSSLADQVEVFGKLTPGDTLVKRGTEELEPKTTIKVKFTLPETAAKPKE